MSFNNIHFGDMVRDFVPRDMDDLVDLFKGVALNFERGVVELG